MSASQPESGTSTGRYLKKSNIAWVVAAVLVTLLAVYALSEAGSSPGPTNTQTTSTSYGVTASSVILAAVQQNPAGYDTTSTGQLRAVYPGEQSAADAILSSSQSAANMTVAVFSSVNSSLSYYEIFSSNVKGLAGYTDITSVLSGYEQYGACYAYGEDVDGIAVTNGICTDGNVVLLAHLSSSESFAQLEGDLSSLMNAMYQSV